RFPRLLTLACLFALGTTRAAEPDRGQLLYENHCSGCHESTIHLREDREADSPAAVREQILRWQEHLELPWTDEEVDAVLRYLNRRFYRFDLTS
ncbi:MAG: cytochrome c, partial [Candidatus Competibacterales bacterium]|nr:cytochrome c [Candidatus Competibacterales bacterium]